MQQQGIPTPEVTAPLGVLMPEATIRPLQLLRLLSLRPRSVTNDSLGQKCRRITRVLSGAPVAASAKFGTAAIEPTEPRANSTRMRGTLPRESTSTSTTDVCVGGVLTTNAFEDLTSERSKSFNATSPKRKEEELDSAVMPLMKNASPLRTKSLLGDARA